MTLAPLLVLALAAGACSGVSNRMYAGPGWYLEKPHQLVASGPEIFKGPLSYDQCEAERTKLPKVTADEMLCFRHLAPPGVAGPYLTDTDIRWGAYPSGRIFDPDTTAAGQEQRDSSGPRP